MNKMKIFLDEIKTVFEQSDVKKYAEKNDKNWYYSLCTSKPKIGQPLIIGLNWGAGNEDFKPQDYSKLPNQTNWNEMGSLSRIKPYLKNNFPLLKLQDFNQTNYSFFRSHNEGQLSSKDIKLTEPIFENFISAVKPQIMFGFSSKLRNFLLSKNKIKYLNKEIVANGKSSILIYQGFIKLGNWWSFINLLPHSNAWRYKNRDEKLNTIWQFARRTFPYECHFTNFLNFLESKNIKPVLSEKPLEEKGIRQKIMEKNAFNFPNLGLYKYKKILPNEFNLRDIALINQLCVKHSGEIEKVIQDYINIDADSIIDSENFFNSYYVSKLSLQRFYIANKYPNLYEEYKRSIQQDQNLLNKF